MVKGAVVLALALLGCTTALPVGDLKPGYRIDDEGELLQVAKVADVEKDEDEALGGFGVTEVIHAPAKVRAGAASLLQIEEGGAKAAFKSLPGDDDMLMAQGVEEKIVLPPKQKAGVAFLQEAEGQDDAVPTAKAATLGADDDADMVGGFGVAELPPQMRYEKPLAGLLQLDEDKSPKEENLDTVVEELRKAATVQACPDCSMPVVSVPKDFSGDLNELAEQAYAPTKEQSERVWADATAKIQHDIDFDDEVKEGIISTAPMQYGMKPGDELIGGQGVAEDDGIEGLLQMAEGTLLHGNDDHVPLAHRESPKDAAKSELQQREKQLQMLQKMQEDEQKQIADLKQAIQTASAHSFEKDPESVMREDKVEAEAAFKHDVEAVRRKADTRAVELEQEENRIVDRETATLEAEVKQTTESVAKTKEELETALAQAQQYAATSSKRLRDLQGADRAAWAPARSPDSPMSLRDQLQAQEQVNVRLRHSIDDDEADMRELSDKVRVQDQAKNLLDKRLGTVHAREEVLEKREADFEAEGAHLRSELDGEYAEDEQTANRLASARNSMHDAMEHARQRALEGTMTHEQIFEKRTLKAAQDEIARLKAELEKAESKESHSEQILVQQEKTVSEEGRESEKIEAEAKQMLQDGKLKVVEMVEDAERSADAILKRAMASTPEIEKDAAEEVMEAHAVEIGNVEEQQNELRTRLHEEEDRLKAEAAEMRAESDAEIKAYAAKAEAEFENTKKQRMEELEKQAQQKISELEKKMEAQIQDAEADYVMAKIHADKSEAQQAELQKKEDELQADIKRLKAERKAEKDEWRFQQFAQSQDQ